MNRERPLCELNLLSDIQFLLFPSIGCILGLSDSLPFYVIRLRVYKSIPFFHIIALDKSLQSLFLGFLVNVECFCLIVKALCLFPRTSLNDIFTVYISMGICSPNWKFYVFPSKEDFSHSCLITLFFEYLLFPSYFFIIKSYPSSDPSRHHSHFLAPIPN